jgi:hypothetical protein
VLYLGVDNLAEAAECVL